MIEKKQVISLHVNGELYQLNVGTAHGCISPADTLAQTLRDKLLLTGCKLSCDDGACGCCTVILNGKPVPSCTVLTVECDGACVRTIEGLENLSTGELNPLQQAFVDNAAFQCGYCTPGIIMAAQALLESNPHPSEQEIKEGLAGNYCRCISHYQVIKAVQQAARGGDTQHG